MQNKGPHPDELTVAETITLLRLNMLIASNLLNPICTCMQGHDASVTGVEKEKWKLFRKRYSGSGAAAGDESRGRWTIGWELRMILWGLSCWGFRLGTKVN